MGILRDDRRQGKASGKDRPAQRLRLCVSGPSWFLVYGLALWCSFGGCWRRMWISESKQSRSLENEAGVNEISQSGLWGKVEALGDQEGLGVRSWAGAIPLSQAGTRECLEGEGCLTWPACWVPGVNDSAVCSWLQGSLGRGPEKRCVGIQRDQVRKETRMSLRAEPRKDHQRQATETVCSASHSLVARPGSWPAWPLSVESWWPSWPTPNWSFL